jgi:hypothetical protein
MNRLTPSITLLLLASSLIASENNTHELPTLSGYRPSIAIVGEENMVGSGDQGRTFAALAYYQTGNNRFLVNYDMLTAWLVYSKQGKEVGHASSRTDRIDGIYSYKVAVNNNLYVRLGVGARYYGNIGGETLQNNVHKVISVNNDNVQEHDKYDDNSGIAALGQLVIGGITPEIGTYHAFANINADVTSSQELSYHGFAGLSISKIIYFGAYVNQEKQPYTDTSKIYQNSPIDENVVGVRVALSLKNIYADVSFNQTSSHLRVGFSF